MVYGNLKDSQLDIEQPGGNAKLVIGLHRTENAKEEVPMIKVKRLLFAAAMLIALSGLSLANGCARAGVGSGAGAGGMDPGSDESMDNDTTKQPGSDTSESTGRGIGTGGSSAGGGC